jgi:hypothetical protein
MRKRILEKLTVGGFGLFVLGVIIFVLSGAGSFSAGGFIAGILFGYLILMGGIVLQTVAWVGALIAQAKRQQWGWFVCTIIFGFLSLWLYLLIVPEAPEPEVATPVAFSYPPMQGYAPGQPATSASYGLPGQPYQLYQSPLPSQPAPSERFEQPRE